MIHKEINSDNSTILKPNIFLRLTKREIFLSLICLIFLCIIVYLSFHDHIVANIESSENLENKIIQLESTSTTETDLIIQLKDELSNKFSEIVKLKNELSEKSDQIDKLEYELRSKSDQLIQLEEELLSKLNLITHLESALSIQNNSIAQVKEIQSIPWIAIIVATFISFPFGAVWYMLLSNPWMKAAGLTNEDVQGGAGSSMYIITFICQLFMAFVLSGIAFHVGSMFGSSGYSIINGVGVGFVIWIGFIIPTQIVNHLFQSKPFSLTAIDGGHWLGVLVIQGIIIGLFG